MADQKVDVHAHFLSPTYRKALVEHGYKHPDGMPGPPTWSKESHLAFMDSQGIEKSILSVSSPGTNITSDAQLNQNLTRESNSYAAEVKASNPERFGYFASLPLPDIEATLDEIGRVLDGPHKADGIALYSNNSGQYLGDPALRPVLQALNSRNVIVFVHPTSPCPHAGAGADCQNPEERYATSAPLATTSKAPMFEFFFDSARSVLDLIMSGTARRFFNIRWIITHCGGMLPSLLDRMIMFTRLGPAFNSFRGLDPVTEEDVKAIVRGHFWSDLAANPVPNMVEALLKFTGKNRLLFGSDVPWTPFKAAGDIVQQIERELPACIGAENLEIVYRENAMLLLSAGL